MAEFSVITAMRRTDIVAEMLASLQAQTVEDWEWVIVPTETLDLGTEVSDASNVVIVVDDDAMGDANVAHQLGVEAATGSIIVLLRDAETLAPDALASIGAALDDDATDIVYSDFALHPIDGRPVPGYNPEYGWITDSIVVGGEPLRTVEVFEPIPSVIGDASYAPRHALAMSRDTYDKVGGHDQTLGHAATFGLVCTAYLAGMRFNRVPRVLVHVRSDLDLPRDSYLEEVIARNSRMDIIREWSHRNGLTMLDLGAAHNPAPGFVAVDLQDAAIECDVRFGLPLPDSSVGAIRASDFLEHMNTCADSSCTHGADGTSPRCVVGMMNEFHRVLAPGGWLLTHTPSTDGRGAFQDPTHSSYWNPNSFWYYTRSDQARFVRGITCRFQVARLWQGFPTPWHRENNLVYVDADLVALKDQRQPGICEI